MQLETGLVIRIGGQQKLVEAEAIFTQREQQSVFARRRDVEPDFARLTAVIGGGALFAGPRPNIFTLAPLHAPSALGPRAIEAGVDAIVLRAGGQRPHPDEIAARSGELHFIRQHRHLAGFVSEVFAFDQLVIVGAAGIGKGLQICAAAGIEALFAFPLANRIQFLADECLGFDPDRLGEGGGGEKKKIGKTHLRRDSTIRPTLISLSEAMFSQYSPVVPNALGFGLSRQKDWAIPIAALLVSKNEKTTSPGLTERNPRRAGRSQKYAKGLVQRDTCWSAGITGPRRFVSGCAVRIKPQSGDCPAKSRAASF